VCIFNWYYIYIYHDAHPQHTDRVRSVCPHNAERLAQIQAEAVGAVAPQLGAFMYYADGDVELATRLRDEVAAAGSFALRYSSRTIFN
jgi:hypothetical protein